MKVALLANLKQNAPTWPDMLPDQWDNLDSWDTIQAVTLALESAGHRVTFLEGDASLYNNLLAIKPDICFNICGGHFGNSAEAQIPAILELLRIPYSGSRVLALALAHDKAMTRRLLTYHGLPTPAFQVFESEDEPLNSHLQFPLSVKSGREGINIKEGSKFIVGDEAQLRKHLRHILGVYQQPALVEHFIEGREVKVGIVGNLARPVARHIPEDKDVCHTFQGLYFLPPLELDMVVYTDEDTTRATVDSARDFHYLCPAPLKESQVETLNWLAAATFRVIGCLDVARVDFRLDANDNDKPYILEVNLLPGLNPDYSGLCLEANAAGWRYEELINRILDEAIERHQLNLTGIGLQHKPAEEKLPLVA